MVTRQEAVLSFVKFNKFAKQLIYDICIGGNTKLTSYAEELLQFEQWKEDIMLYINFNPDPIIIEKIASLGSPEMLENYINDGKETLPQNTLDALTGVVNAMNSIHDLCYNINQESKGKFRFLVDEFANEEAAALFDRAVSAGYLTAEYQPKGDTDNYTLKIIAFAIGELLHLTMRHKWSHFEEQWSINRANKLSTLPISERQFKRAGKLMQLYPEVDFTMLTAPNEDKYFDAAYGARRVRALYQELLDHGYISPDQQHLSYFIYFTFSKTNKDYWVKTVACFSVNGHAPHKGSLVTGLVAMQRKPNFGTFDVELKRIASKYNNG